MSRRRLAALAWLGPIMAGLASSTSTPANAAPPICVGVVVSPGALGGGSNTYCAKVADGSTGSQVLYARANALGRPAPTYRRDGLLCTIDGLPSEGCAKTDSTHYWSYWHRPAGAGSWQYSNEGPASYRPSDRSEEGWSWQNGGSSEAANPPPLVNVDAICPQPATAPQPGARASATAPAPPAATSATEPGRTAPTRSAATAGAPSAAAAAAATASIGQLVSPSDLPMAGGGPAPGDASKSAASDSVTSPSPARATSRHPSRSGSPMGLLGGVLLVGGIGAAAGLRARRGR